MKIAVPYENGEICSHLAQVKEFLIFDVVDDEIISTKTGKQTDANDPGALVDHAERNRRGRAVFVADELLGVEVVHALILGWLAAEGEALADVLEGGKNALAERAGENGGLGRGIIDEFAGLGAKLRDLALIDDDHALTVGDGDHRAVGNDVV